MADTPLIPRRTAVARMGLAALGLGVMSPAESRDTRLVRRDNASDEDFERLLRLASVPSMAYAIIDGDKISTKAVGVRRAGEPERVTADTVYAAASLTKTVFSYVLLGLVNEGVLSLDRPAREYLALPNPDDPRAPAITLRRLLSHSGGWRNWRFNATQPLTSDFEPGTRWSYSGEGFFYMQRILEKLIGKGMSQLARERVFEPLGMKRSSMVVLAELEPFLAAPHSSRGEVIAPNGQATLMELRRAMAARGLALDMVKTEDSEAASKVGDPALPVLPVFLNPNAAASMLTTANDFGIFLRHLVTAKRKGGAPAMIVEQMTSPQIRCNEAVQWGLGVGLEDIGSRRYAWQWGDNTGYKHIYLADMQNEKAMVVFTNGDRGARVYERVVRATLGEDHPAFLWV